MRPDMKKQGYDPLHLRNEIRLLRQRFEDHAGGPVTMNADNVAYVLTQLRQFEALAREMGNEISASRWNAQKRDDDAVHMPSHNAALLHAVQTSGGKVRLLVPRAANDAGNDGANDEGAIS